MKRLAIFAVSFAILAAVTACESSKSGRPQAITSPLDKSTSRYDLEQKNRIGFKPLSPKEKWQCMFDGGEESVGDNGVQCLRPAKDAGKKCKTQKDCEFLCDAATYTCLPTEPLVGACYDYVANNGQIDYACFRPRAK